MYTIIEFCICTSQHTHTLAIPISFCDRMTASRSRIQSLQSSKVQNCCQVSAEGWSGLFGCNELVSTYNYFQCSLGPWRTAGNSSRNEAEFTLILFACDLLGHAGCCSWDPHTTIVAETGQGTTVFVVYQSWMDMVLQCFLLSFNWKTMKKRLPFCCLSDAMCQCYGPFWSLAPKTGVFCRCKLFRSSFSSATRRSKVEDSNRGSSWIHHKMDVKDVNLTRIW